MTKDELLTIFDNAHNQSQPWMIQGLGMLQLKLDDTRNRRLHVWDSRYEIPDHTEIHNHPWDFKSTVLNGAIFNTTYSVREFGWTKTHKRITIKCGPDACIPSEPVDVGLRFFAENTYKKGKSYKMEKSRPHSTWQAPGTITLIERSNHDPENKADIFYPIGGSWVSAEFRKATKEEINDILSEARKYL